MYKSKRKLIGCIGVDAGLCWIGDPCYVLPHDADDNPGHDWSAFCDQLKGQYQSFNYKHGREGIGICVSTGWGDGLYDVYADILESKDLADDGRIMSVTIEFIRPDDDDDAADGFPIDEALEEDIL